MGQATTAGGCCGPPPRWVLDRVTVGTRSIDRVGAALAWRDRLGMLACRVSDSFRMGYAVEPGLFALGAPGPDSPVLATGNYKYSFDALRMRLAGRAAWILVLDTKGINVWCAAGKGTFGTAELVKRIESARLSQVVAHREVVVPQLGAPGVRAHEVARATGFRVVYGPVRAADLPAWLDNGRAATPAMRTVRFPLTDRAVLVPMEFLPALRKAAWPLVALVAVLGLSTNGILFQPAWQAAWPVLAAAGLALVLGTAVHALLLPFIPARAFTVKGLLLGLGGVALWWALPGMPVADPYLVTAVAVGLPAWASYLAFNFTGSTTFTSPSGVKKELRVAFRLYRVAAAVVVLALAGYKLRLEGLL